MAKCASEGCPCEGEWLPVLYIGEGQLGPGEESMSAELHLAFCGDHKKVLRVSDILTDESWGDMTAHFQAQGKLMPDREKIELDFRHLVLGRFH